MTLSAISNTATNELHPPGATSSSMGDLDASGALLPAPAVVSVCTGDVGAEIALLSVRTGNDEEKIDTTAQQAEDQAQWSAEQAEVGEMRTEASDIMSNAVLAGVMQIGQGSIQMAGAGAAPSDQGTFTGGASLFGAGATLFTASGQAQQQLDQAIVTSYKATADRAGEMSSQATSAQSDAKSIVSNAIQFYQQYAQAKGQLDLVAAGQKA